jgi:pyocin large subunit-like protein
LSAAWSAWAKQQTTGSASAKLVLLVLADVADLDGWAALSLPDLAVLTEQSAASVHRKLGQLVEAGLIERRSGSGRSVSQYRLLSSQPSMA